MSVKIRITLYQRDTIVLRRLFLVIVGPAFTILLIVYAGSNSLGIFAGLGWSYPCDIWSVGCILVELCTVRFLISSCQLFVIVWVMPLYSLFLHIIGTGWGVVSNTWELGAPCNDGTCSWSPPTAYVEESRVSDYAMPLPLVFVLKYITKWLNGALFILDVISRQAEKYVRKCRLDWPEGAASRESIKAVQRLPRLQVCFMHCLFWVFFLRVYNDKMVSFYHLFLDLCCRQSAAEPCNAACGSFCRRSHSSLAGPTSVWSFWKADCSWSP